MFCLKFQSPRTQRSVGSPNKSPLDECQGFQTIPWKPDNNIQISEIQTCVNFRHFFFKMCLKSQLTEVQISDICCSYNGPKVENISPRLSYAIQPYRKLRKLLNVTVLAFGVICWIHSFQIFFTTSSFTKPITGKPTTQITSRNTGFYAFQ